jgi:uncharacterized membrane protein
VCFGLAYTMFGNIGSCAAFTLICFIVKLILFYYHERIWHQISFGKQPVESSMTDDERFFQQFNVNIKQAGKTMRRALLTFLAINVGCGLVSVATVTCVILGCLKLFRVI